MNKKKLPEDPGPRPHFTFLRQWYESIEELPPGNKGRMLLGIVRYALDHKEPEFTETLDRILWKQIKAAIDYGWMKYNAGKLGGEAARGRSGAPEGNQNARRDKQPF